MPYRAQFAELDPENCRGLSAVMQLNDIDHDLSCEAADPRSFGALTTDHQHIDLVHIDIQGAELRLLNDSSVRDIMETRVYRIIVGTHSELIHKKVAHLFRHWIPIFNLPVNSSHSRCFGPHLVKYLFSPLLFSSGPKFPGPEDWEKARETGCNHETPHGRVVHYDGMLILDNPVFVEASRAFSLSDAHLRISDLK
ncbi:unnamed protein product [Polarella glacialis]|uniref:Methyltransferase FkbM domain-containing protein n=1 Tax=Polarella glacialis TaxID=89957 RepID=A0A813GGV3_POLGL|nr:unnamed protein product [Polarella glacialis]